MGRTGFGWLRIGSSGELLWTQWWTSGFRKKVGNFLTSWVTISFSNNILHHGVSIQNSEFGSLGVMELVHRACSGTQLEFLSKYRVLVYFLWLHYVLMGRDSSVGIALGYGLDSLGSRVRFPAGAGNSSLHRVQNGSGVHPASNPVGTRGSFPGGKAVGAWSWPLTSI
jgi:hypothetical protein